MIVSKAVDVRTLILDLTMALTVGFALGYGVREWISHRRRQAERRDAASMGASGTRRASSPAAAGESPAGKGAARSFLAMPTKA